ncbi:MAG: GNAT family N-acetyltransferase [Anaerolineae bacterium]|nr:GNAT family N-acetyltransferase [Anaerolineae bacterium]
MITLETDRLIIRDFRPDDWQELLELAIRYQASEYAKYDHPWPTTEEEVRGMAEWLSGEEGFRAVCLKSTGKLIGLLNIDRKKDVEEREHGFGYVFHPDYHNQGYATEACQAGISQIFGPWKAERICTGTHPNNTPSVRLLRKLGFREVGEGEFAISREEWLALDHPSH